MSQTARKRVPDITRSKILQAAYQEIHVQGFQSASMSEILRKAGVTKGALYHHFENKMALGYAVVDEVVAAMLEEEWIGPLRKAGPDVIPVLAGLLHETAKNMTDEDIELGCPLNNLAQEMSPIDEGFRIRVNALFETWQKVLQGGLQKGIEAGTVTEGVDPRSAAVFIVATLEGCIGMAKNARSRSLLTSCGEGLLSYLDTLTSK